MLELPPTSRRYERAEPGELPDERGGTKYREGERGWEPNRKS